MSEIVPANVALEQPKLIGESNQTQILINNFSGTMIVGQPKIGFNAAQDPGPARGSHCKRHPSQKSIKVSHEDGNHIK